MFAPFNILTEKHKILESSTARFRLDKKSWLTTIRLLKSV